MVFSNSPWLILKKKQYRDFEILNPQQFLSPMCIIQKGHEMVKDLVDRYKAQEWGATNPARVDVEADCFVKSARQLTDDKADTTTVNPKPPKSLGKNTGKRTRSKVSKRGRGQVNIPVRKGPRKPRKTRAEKIARKEKNQLYRWRKRHRRRNLPHRITGRIRIGGIWKVATKDENKIKANEGENVGDRAADGANQTTNSDDAGLQKVGSKGRWTNADVAEQTARRRRS